MVHLGMDGTTGAGAAADTVRAQGQQRRLVVSDLRLLDPFDDEGYDRLVTLLELALTPDELAALEYAPLYKIETTLALLRAALGDRTSISQSTVRGICGFA
jgi:hypothetical protein